MVRLAPLSVFNWRNEVYIWSKLWYLKSPHTSTTKTNNNIYIIIIYSFKDIVVPVSAVEFVHSGIASLFSCDKTPPIWEEVQTVNGTNLIWVYDIIL